MNVRLWLKIAERILRNRPFYATFDVTSRCNSRCVYCGARDNKLADLPISEIQEILENIYRFGIRYISIQGGEPFLRKDIFEIMDLLEAMGFAYAVTTNAIAIDENILENLKKRKPNNLMVSLDSLKSEVYRKLRGVDQFDRVCNCLESLQANLYPATVLRINAVITEDNAGEVADLVSYAERIGAQFSATPCISGRGFSHRSNGTSIRQSPRHEAEAFRLLAKMKADRRAVYGTRRFYELAAQYVEGNFTGPCDANKRILHISTDGQVSVCQDFKPFGDLKSDELTDIWSPKMQASEITSCQQSSGCYYLCTRLLSEVLRSPSGLIDYFQLPVLSRLLKS